MAVIVIIVFCIVMMFYSRRTAAYYNHSLTAHGALENQEYLQKKVVVEKLQAFLLFERVQVGMALDNVDTWSAKNIAGYQSVPLNLKFVNSASENLETAFLEAIRANPLASRENYLQIVDGSSCVAEQQLVWNDICVTDYKYSFPYVRIYAGQEVKALDVVATAADEPDYGLDMGLWNNNATVAGSRYGFGKQPFADPSDLVQSQAPFHLSFMHDKFLRLLAKPLRGNYTLLRIKTYSELAKLARQTGHEYWACRFAGRALHYIHDLTVPFHASMTPGYSLPMVFGAVAAKACGVKKPYEKMFLDIACTHVLFEVMHYERLNSAFVRRDRTAAVYRSLSGGNDEIIPKIDDFYARDIVAKEAYCLRGRAYHAVKKLVIDKNELNRIIAASANSIYNSLPIRTGAKITDENEFTCVLNIIAANSGRHTRTFISHLLSK